MKLIAAILFVLLISGIYTESTAGSRLGKWWKKPEIKKEMSLMPEQEKKIEEVFDSYKGRISAPRMELEDQLKPFFIQKFSDPDSSREELLTAATLMWSAKDELEKLRFEMFLDIREILTLEQRGVLFQIKKRYREQFREKIRARKGADRDKEGEIGASD
ncbi:MAG: hypothetical protein IH874_09225 [Candidatus Dadabacteria bacterium]|nr:hypothetical protein [Candidatus Dadabacteria bacterium]